MNHLLRQTSPWIKLMFPLVWLILLMLLTAAGSGGQSSMTELAHDPKFVIVMKVLQAITVLLIFIIPSFVMAFLLQPDSLRSLQLHKRAAIPTYMLVIILMVAGLPLINWLSELNLRMSLPASMSGIEEWMKASEENIKGLTEMFLADTSVGGLVLNLFVIAFMAAVSEELFFRGVLQRTMIDTTRSVHAGVWITAALFSAIHLQFYGFLPRMVLGAVLGYLFVWSRSLWVSILAHFVNNALAVVVAWMMARGEVKGDVDKLGTQENELIFSLSSVIIFCALLFTIYRIEKRRRDSAEPPQQSIME